MQSWREKAILAAHEYYNELDLGHLYDTVATLEPN